MIEDAAEAVHLVEATAEIEVAEVEEEEEGEMMGIATSEALVSLF